MTATVYRIKTNRPLLWRTPDSLQVGVDLPRVEVHELSPRIAPLIHALQEGISEEGLKVLARSIQVDADEVERVVTTLSPSFDADPLPPQPLVGVTGSSRATPLIADALIGMGMQVRRADNPDALVSECPHGIALIADYLAHPEWTRSLTRFDVAHTPVLFSDRFITVGPIVRPGSSPCLACLEGERRARDPEWLSVGTQLWSERSPLSDQRGALLATQLLGMLWGYPDLSGLIPALSQPGSSFRLEPVSGEVSLLQASFDPHCRCRGL